MGLSVKNCRECGRLFNWIAGDRLCPACKEAMEKKFAEVKEYIRNNKGATVQSVSEECDVAENQIRQWIREERLEFHNASIAGVTCEVCGAPITTGRFCDKCKTQMVNDLGQASKRPEAPVPQMKKIDRENPRMRFLDRN